MPYTPPALQNLVDLARQTAAAEGAPRPTPVAPGTPAGAAPTPAPAAGEPQSWTVRHPSGPPPRGVPAKVILYPDGSLSVIPPLPPQYRISFTVGESGGLEPFIYRVAEDSPPPTVEQGAPTMAGADLWQDALRLYAAQDSTGAPRAISGTFGLPADVAEYLNPPTIPEAPPGFRTVAFAADGSPVYMPEVPGMPGHVFWPHMNAQGDIAWRPVKSDSIPDWANTLVDILHKVGAVALTAVGGGAAVPLIEKAWGAAGFDVSTIPGMKF